MLRRVLADPRKRRWIGWVALAGAYVLLNFHRVSTAVLAERLAAVFGTTGAQLGLLHAAFFYVYAPMQVFAGVFADRLGTRRVATVGSAVMGAGVVWFALSPSYAQGFLARLLIGAGGSVLYITTLRYCANWYRADQFATLAGLTLAASAVGGLFAATPLAVFAAAVGWRAALLAVGTVGFGFTAAVLVLVRDSPRDAGLPTIEGTPQTADQSISDVLAGVRQIFAERETWIMGVMLFCVTGVNFTVLGLWGVPYVVQAYDTSVATASLYALVGNAGLIVGSPLIGWLSDRIGRRTEIILAAAVVYLLAYLPIVVLGTPPLWYVGAAFFLVMFLLGGFSLSYTVVKERHAAEHSGTATGTINAMGFSGAAVVPGVMGYALDVFWTGETAGGSRVYTLPGYRVAFSVAVLGALVALGCAAYLHRRV